MSGLFDTPLTVPAPPRAGEYRTLMFDPPWKEQGGGKIRRGANRHYDLMKTRDIAGLPVGSWAAPDAHLYLWVTNNFLPDGFEVMKAWGFRYVTKIEWFKGDIDDETFFETCASLPDDGARALVSEMADEKLQMGIGQYFRGCTEPCLFGVRGSLPYRMLPNGKRAQGRTGFHAPRTQHSAKPEKFRRVVERVSHGPYLEGFARRQAPGWDVWGHEVGS